MMQEILFILGSKKVLDILSSIRHFLQQPTSQTNDINIGNSDVQDKSNDCVKKTINWHFDCTVPQHCLYKKKI